MPDMFVDTNDTIPDENKLFLMIQSDRNSMFPIEIQGSR